MNHYELIYIVNPQQAKESKLFDKCKEQISSVSGVLHRSEDIGLRDLSTIAGRINLAIKAGTTMRSNNIFIIFEFMLLNNILFLYAYKQNF